MNFAKKTFAAVMSVAMLVSSLATCTTAFAANAKKQFAVIESSATIAATATEKQDAYGYTSYDVDGDNYFTYTPAKTGYYKIDLAATPIYANKEAVEGSAYTTTKYSYTPASADSQRVDWAVLGVYEKYNETADEFSKQVGETLYTSSFEFATAYTQKAVGEYPEASGYQQYDAATTVKLVAGKTYYINAYCDYWSNYIPDSNGKRDFFTGGKITIAPTDWIINLCSKELSSQKFSVTVNNGYWVEDEYGDEYYVTVDGTSTEVIKRSVYTPYISTKYVGAGKEVVVPDNINGIPVEAVSGTDNKAITSLTLSSNVKSISNMESLTALTSVNLASVEKVEEYCFYNDTALKSISIPATLKKIPCGAFCDCTALTSAAIENGVKKIESWAFYNTALSSITIPASVTSIGSYAVGYVSNLDEDTVAPYDTTAVAAEGFVLATKGCAEAFEYSAINDIPCYDVTNGCPHPYITTTVPATLFAKGSKTSVCPICGATTKKTIKKKTFKLSSLKAAKKALTVKAAKQEGITGYQVQYSTSKKFTKKTTTTITVSSTGALNEKITNLKSGKKYYVRARAIGDAEGKTVYSAYTPAKSVKVK